MQVSWGNDAINGKRIKPIRQYVGDFAGNHRELSPTEMVLE